MEHHSITEMWHGFKQTNKNSPDHYSAWAFGNSEDMATELAELVLNGTKTATASNYLLYEDGEELPYVGLHNIILDGNGEAVAIIKTTAVNIIPFDEVTAEHAYLEGEGDRTLKYWRDVHEAYFKRELEGLNHIDKAFHYKIPIVCEQFELIYK